MSQTTKNDYPKHIAIVMDGNGRWAKERNLPRIFGHQEGTQAVQRAVEFCLNNHVEVLTLFALSVENFKNRPRAEVDLLMQLFLESLQINREKLNTNQVRLHIIGDRNIFSANLQAKIEETENLTINHTKLTLVIAINYSGRWDIVEAAKRLAKQVLEKQKQLEDISYESFANELCLHDLPEPDLLIRTSGEKRISNFMLWQFAYTELYFSQIHWPDFDENVFKQAIECYRTRQRRFGHTSEQIESNYA